MNGKKKRVLSSLKFVHQMGFPTHGICYQRVHMFMVLVSFVLQDNGRGMPHDEIPNMFGRGVMLLICPEVHVRFLFSHIYKTMHT